MTWPNKSCYVVCSILVSCPAPNVTSLLYYNVVYFSSTDRSYIAISDESVAMLTGESGLMMKISTTFEQLPDKVMLLLSSVRLTTYQSFLKLQRLILFQLWSTKLHTYINNFPLHCAHAMNYNWCSPASYYGNVKKNCTLILYRGLGTIVSGGM